MTSPTGRRSIRIIYALLAAWFALLGLYMLIDPAGWFVATPGVADEGPMNAHFIRDIGAAFLTVAVLYGFSMYQNASWQLPAAAAILPGLHGIIHLWSILTGHTHGDIAALEMSLIVLPGGLAVCLAVFHYKIQHRKEEHFL